MSSSSMAYLFTIVENLGAVSALEEEAFAFSDFCELLAELPDLSNE